MISYKSFFLFFIAVAIVFATAFYSNKRSYESKISDLRKVHEEFVETYKDEKEKEIDSLKSIQKESVIDFKKKVKSLNDYNIHLNDKIKRYGKNPDFNDYDFLQRANNVSKYRYKPGEENIDD